MLPLPPKNWLAINLGLSGADANTNFYVVKEAFTFFSCIM